MQEFWFYVRLGFDHVMDPGAIDHLLFLSALALPFTFGSWKKVVLLATVFTITHCLSLGLAVYGVLQADSSWIEFLIPVTILFTALFNLSYARRRPAGKHIYLHTVATAFFGLIHGFGFSNYFNMLMAETEHKALPLSGFATGIEISQVIIIFAVLGLGYLLHFLFKDRRVYVLVFSIIIALLTIPMLINAFPD